jgi:hypothetical protein
VIEKENEENANAGKYGRRIRSRSQWPRSLRHELSSPARTLGTWVRIPLKAWMFVMSVFILCLYR